MRGRSGRRELSPDDYQAIQDAIAGGAGADDPRAFGIGSERAARLMAGYQEVNR